MACHHRLYKARPKSDHLSLRPREAIVAEVARENAL